MSIQLGGVPYAPILIRLRSVGRSARGWCENVRNTPCRRCSRKSGARFRRAMTTTASSCPAACARSSAVPACSGSEPSELERLPPVHFVDLRGRDLPPFQVRADTEAHVELRALRREVLNRLHVQVIVVIVRDQHRRRCPRGPRARSAADACASVRSARRDDVGQHGIRHDPHAVDLHQHAGVTEPDRAQALRRRGARSASGASAITGILNCGSRICPWRYRRTVSQSAPPVCCGGVFWNRPPINWGECACVRVGAQRSDRRRRGAARRRSL